MKKSDPKNSRFLACFSDFAKKSCVCVRVCVCVYVCVWHRKKVLRCIDFLIYLIEISFIIENLSAIIHVFMYNFTSKTLILGQNAMFKNNNFLYTCVYFKNRMRYSAQLLQNFKIGKYSCDQLFLEHIFFIRNVGKIALHTIIAFSIFDWVKPWIKVKNQLSNFDFFFVYIWSTLRKKYLSWSFCVKVGE